MCESVTDENVGTVAGRCKCKQFVTGDRCDICVSNYRNLRADNPNGCERKFMFDASLFILIKQ